MHERAELTGGSVPAHEAGAYPSLSCCGGSVTVIPVTPESVLQDSPTADDIIAAHDRLGHEGIGCGCLDVLSLVDTSGAAARCQWLARCPNPATGTRTHIPFRGATPNGPWLVCDVHAAAS